MLRAAASSSTIFRSPTSRSRTISAPQTIEKWDGRLPNVNGGAVPFISMNTEPAR
jgi:hypothetical protein